MPGKAIKDFERLCLHTMTTKPWEIEEAIANYSVAGIRGISVWREWLSGRDPKKIATAIRRAGMKVVSLVRGGFFPGRTQEERQAAIANNRQAIEEAAELQAPMLILVCGAVPGQTIQESLRQIESGLETILPYAEKQRIKLAIEPLHPMYADSRSAVTTMHTANELAERFHSPYLGVAVDVFHVWWDPDLEAQIARCATHHHLFAFHICDWKPNMSHMLYDRGLMGEGIIPIPEIRTWMEQNGFTGFHEVEIFSHHWWQQDQHFFLEKIKEAYLRYS